jgi:hypothetical protein
MKEIILFLSQNRPGDLFTTEPSRDYKHTDTFMHGHRNFRPQVCTSVDLSHTHKRASQATIRMALNKKLSYDLTSLTHGNLYA